MGIYEIKKPKRINAFSVTLFFIVAISAYLLYWWIPIWWPTFQLSGIMRGICNDAYRNPNDEELVNKLLKESVRTGLRLSKDNFEFVRVPYLEGELPANQVRGGAVEKRGKACKLTFRYQNRYEFPWIGKSVPVTFEKTVETDLSVIRY